MFKNIVVGVDGSETSEVALRLACDLAGKYASEIHLVHTPQPHTVAFALGATMGYHAATTMPSPEEVREAAEKVLNASKAIAKDLGLEITQIRAERGDPAEQIIACAEDCGADLIVTGRRGLGGIGSLVLGSTTQKVNHLAKCACLSVV
ncbi:universal stress protein [Denitrobaculum tricleocarpae]|uniref:Universal stress protein n=1 Tax=Denitrobaculum tricleocarpae TaxID=2591009 RepID=A0A545TL05_9PROT|nr:universal stress protein [Denitrobaculum tricleocarpae]TQV77903.1 universal stress protein [Denitrobaculum tricleocarpae]